MESVSRAPILIPQRPTKFVFFKSQTFILGLNPLLYFGVLCVIRKVIRTTYCRIDRNDRRILLNCTIRALSRHHFSCTPHFTSNTPSQFCCRNNKICNASIVCDKCNSIAEPSLMSTANWRHLTFAALPEDSDSILFAYLDNQSVIVQSQKMRTGIRNRNQWDCNTMN